MIHTSKQTDEWRNATSAKRLHMENGGPIECWCLHGAVGAASDWRGISSHLAKEGIATRAVDLWRFLEHESVPMPEFGLKLNAEAAGEIPRGQRRVLVGYSMGGRLALHSLISGGPWDAAVIISAHPGIRDPGEASARRAADAQWAMRALTSQWTGFLTEWNDQPILKGTSRNAREDDNLIRRRREIARSFVDWSLGSQVPLWQELARIKIPMLWIAGENDLKFRILAEEATALAENSHLNIAPASSHRVPWENEPWLAERIASFADRLNPPGPAQ